MKTITYIKNELLLYRLIIINGSTLENFRENLKIFSIYFHNHLTATNCENFRAEIKINSKKITCLQQVIIFESFKWRLKLVILIFIVLHAFL